MKKQTRILWVSRHPPLPKQISELKRIFGEIELFQYAGFVRDAKHVVELIKSFDVDEVVTIIPMTVIYHLIKDFNVKPLFPEMEEVFGDYDYLDQGSGRKYRFKRFVRLKDIIIVKEEL